MEIRITDLNYGNHVSNQAFLEFIHEARVRFLQHLGHTEMNLCGVGLIMADLALEYKAELLFGDRIEVAVAAGATGKFGFDLWYQVFKIAESGKVLAALAKTGMICFDYRQATKVPVPAELQDLLSRWKPAES